MGTYLTFTLYSGTFLLAFYFIYRLVGVREKQLKLNRTLLLSIYVASLAAWPLSRINVIPISSNTEVINTSATVLIDNATPTPAYFPTFAAILMVIYLIGMFTILTLTLINLFRSIHTVKRGYHIHKKGYTLVVLPHEKTAPFSFFKYIVIGAADIAQERKYVIEHELAHIRGFHFFDLLLAQAVCIILWYNPAAWCMRKELALVHEFLADAEVLSMGADRKEYQMLLIKEATGSKFHLLANNLQNNDLRSRIAMMNKDNSKGIRRFVPIPLILAPLIAYPALNSSIVATEFKNLQSFNLKEFLFSKDNDVNSDLQFVDYYGNPITTIAYVSFSDSDIISEEEPIKLPLTSEEMNGLMFFVNGKLLPKEETPIIFVNGKRWTRPIDEIDTGNIQKCSYREDSKGNPYGIADIEVASTYLRI